MDSSNKRYLERAQEYANLKTGCLKVAVGSAIVKPINAASGEFFTTVCFGANQSIPNSCKTTGCLRVLKYGTNSKLHRNPEDCRALHSEIDAICRCKTRPEGATIFVTRYPCEACARAIVASGISKVVYGRKQTISSETAKIFEFGGVEVVHESDWTYFDVEE